MVPRVPLKLPAGRYFVGPVGEGDVERSLEALEGMKGSKNPAVFSLLRSKDRK
jgi:hypothetical protein